MRSSHISSYYSQTCDTPPSPHLQGALAVEICVIGGGFTGINTAIELAQKGFSVAVIEGNRIGWGATGRNGGQLLRGVGHDVEQFSNVIGEAGVQALYRMGVESVEIVRQRIQQHSIECDLVWGYCDLANKVTHVREFEETLGFLKATNYSHAAYLVDQAELSSIVGSKTYVGGLVDMGSGHLHPLKLAYAETKLAQQLGVRVFEDTPATAISRQNGRLQVQTPEGFIDADRLVVACNAYINGLEPTLSGRVLPAGSYIIATEPLPPSLQEELLPKNMAASDNLVGLNYFRLSRDGRLLFGGACHYSGRDPKDISGYMRPKMLDIFPQLKDVRVDFAWGGMIGIGANRLPQIGRLENQPDIYYAQAYSGHGVNATHLAGKLIAEAIAGANDDFDLFNSIRHITFPGGRILRSPLLALGMFWHRLKDMGR